MHILESLFVIITVTRITIAANYLKEKPIFLNPCSDKDPNFNQCNAKNLQVLFTEWRQGVPGLKTLGPLDPLEIKRARIKHDGGSLLSLQAEVKDVKVYGASTTVIDSAIIRSDSFEVKMHIPKLRFDSLYRARGNVLGLSISGEGKGYVEAENSKGTITGTLHMRRDGDLTFIDVLTLRTTFEDVDNMKIQLNNLFGGQKDLEESANLLFTENWRDLFLVLRPLLEESAENILTDRLRKVFEFVPANYFLSNL